MASRKELLDSIEPNMRLDRAFFLKVYGYELTWTGFAEIAITKLKNAGCSRAGQYYTSITAAWQQDHDQELKKVATWYRGYCEEEYEERKRKAVKECKEKEMELLEKKRALLMKKKVH